MQCIFPRTPVFFYDALISGTGGERIFCPITHERATGKMKKLIGIKNSLSAVCSHQHSGIKPDPSKRTRNALGFTLVEVLVALTIFSIGILAVAGMQITAIKVNSSSNTRSVQTDVTASILAEILTWPVSSFSDETDTPWTFNAGNETVLSGGTYSANYSIDVDYNGVDNLILVEVDVQQTNGLRRTYSATGFKRGI